jgi:hypothetical protein
MAISGSTPFGVFDNDPQFQADGEKVVPYVLQKLGDPVMHVELTPYQIYQSFEEACLEFSSIVNQYQAKSTLTTLLGTPTGTLSGGENKYVKKTLNYELGQTDAYDQLAGVNSSQTLYSGSITVIPGVQHYDLQQLMSGTVNARMRIEKVFHFSPLSAYRFFGTTSAINYLHNQFQFESFTPETVFYLLPIWEDILRGMQFETSNRVRRSQYSYDLRNNVLSLYPAPSESTQLWFQYYLGISPTSPSDVEYYDASGSAHTSTQANGVANISNVPFDFIQYSRLNSIGKNWIWKMTVAFSKELLGQIRSKMTTIPIPNGDLTLNGPELISDARSEADRLRDELRGILEDTTYDKLAEREAAEAENLRRTIAEVPLGIFVG